MIMKCDHVGTLNRKVLAVDQVEPTEPGQCQAGCFKLVAGSCCFAAPGQFGELAHGETGMNEIGIGLLAKDMHFVPACQQTLYQLVCIELESAGRRKRPHDHAEAER